jgi:WD40 repeat protein
VVFSPDGQHLLCGANDNVVQVLHIDSGEIKGFSSASDPWSGDCTWVLLLSLAVSPDSRSIACGFSDGSILVYNMAGEQQRAFRPPQELPLGLDEASLAFCPLGLQLLFSGRGTVSIWTIQNGALDEMKPELGFSMSANQPSPEPH